MNGALFLAALAWISIGFAAAEPRVFTNTAGNEIKAEVYMLRGAKVTLTREDGKRFVLPVSSLSEADRSYLIEWAKDLPRVKLSYRFRAEEGKTWGVGEIENIEWTYAIEIRNTGKTDVPAMKLRCSVFKTPSGKHPDAKPGQGYLDPVVSTIDVPEISAGKQADLRSKSLPVKKHKPSKTGDSKLLGSSNWSERLAGIRVELMQGDRVVDVSSFGRLPDAGK